MCLEISIHELFTASFFVICARIQDNEGRSVQRVCACIACFAVESHGTFGRLGER